MINDASLNYEIAVEACRTLSGFRTYLLTQYPDDAEVPTWREQEQQYHRQAEALCIGNAAENQELVESLGAQIRTERAMIAAREAQVRRVA